MIWQIKIPTNIPAQLHILFGNNVLAYIKRYIVSHQHLFTKTRNQLGISGPHRNYIPGNVSLAGIQANKVIVNLNIKGIERAFRPIVILPKSTKYLAIPKKAEAANKSPKQIPGLFKPKGLKVLAKNISGRLDIYYSLASQVYQPVDRRLLPTENEVVRYATRSLNIR